MGGKDRKNHTDRPAQGQEGWANKCVVCTRFYHGTSHTCPDDTDPPDWEGVKPVPLPKQR